MANEDWDEALRRIEAAAGHSEEEIDLSGLEIDRLPDKIVEQSGIGALNLSYTNVADISAVAELRGLVSLKLNGAPVSDLSPLTHLQRLASLYLKGTNVEDISPLIGLKELYLLDLGESRVRDLRSLLQVPMFASSAGGGKYGWKLEFDGTPACEDTMIERIAKITGDANRIPVLIQYLRSLPPWPEPLPGRPHVTPAVPDAVPAPLDARVTDRGTLEAVFTGDPDQAERDAWQALREMLEDLEDLRPGIHNAMPRLAKALVRVDTALGPGPDACNAIHLGMHGTRVIALAELAPDALMDEAATEVQSFAALLALHLQRFPAWTEYVGSRPEPSLEEAEAAAPALQEVSDALKVDGVDPLIPETLDGLIEAQADEPENALTRKGLFDAMRNTLSGLFRGVVQEAKDIGASSWGATKKGIGVAIGGSLAAGILAAIEASSGALTVLSSSAPSAFGWLKPILAFLASLGL